MKKNPGSNRDECLSVHLVTVHLVRLNPFGPGREVMYAIG